VHAQFFRQNPLACPITNFHLLSNVANGPTSILTDELLNSCQFQELCNLWVSLCFRRRQLIWDRSWTGHATETPVYDSSFGPRSLVESFLGFP
jgi:hypothetical protein